MLAKTKETLLTENNKRFRSFLFSTFKVFRTLSKIIFKNKKVKLKDIKTNTCVRFYSILLSKKG